jgi:hypothetical protein
MIQIIKRYYICGLFILFSFFLNSCFKDITQRNIVYFNDFENQSRPYINVYNAVGPIDSSKITLFNNTHVLGRFNNDLVIFEMDNLPNHNVLKVEFDLYLHDNWKGNYIAPGRTAPELWYLLLDNNNIYQTSFSNNNFDQSFPNNYQAGMTSIKALSNAWGVLPGICAKAGQEKGTSMYKIEIITSHKGAIKLAFNNDPSTPLTLCEKSWSIDNLKLTALTNL